MSSATEFAQHLKVHQYNSNLLGYNILGTFHIHFQNPINVTLFLMLNAVFIEYDFLLQNSRCRIIGVERTRAPGSGRAASQALMEAAIALLLGLVGGMSDVGASMVVNDVGGGGVGSELVAGWDQVSWAGERPEDYR